MALAIRRPINRKIQHAGFKKNMKLFLKCSLFFLIFCGVVETAGRLLWWAQKKELFSPQRAWEGNNSFAAEIGGTMAGYTATLSSHPYLVHVHKPGHGINRQGLFGPDFPEGRSPDFYQMLITGGSVACQLAGISPDEGALTEELEKKYLSYEGKPIRVYNGADGAWKLPQQTVLLMMYAKRFDLVISIDGFNENYVVRGDPYYIEIPSPSYRVVSPLGFHAKSALAILWTTAEINQALSRIPAVRKTFTAYCFGQGLLNLAKFYDEKSRPRQTPVTPLEYPQTQSGQDQRLYRKNEQLIQLDNYLGLNQVICRQQDSFYMSVLQPCPALGKSLTEDEKKIVGSLDYKEDYLKMASVYQNAATRNRYPFLSLINVFASEKSSVYKDHIHCENGKNSLGYGIMANALCDFLTKEKIIKRNDINKK